MDSRRLPILVIGAGLWIVSCTGVAQQSSPPCRLGIPAPACGTSLATYPSVGGEIAFSNGQDQGTGCSCAHGAMYQCVEYVKRFYSDVLAVDTSHWTGNANQYFATSTAKGLVAFPNGSSTPPAPNDILVFDGDTYGHASIVTRVTQTEVDVIEQNWSATGTASLSSTSGSGLYTIQPRGHYQVLGWLRKPTVSSKLSFVRTDLPVGTEPRAVAVGDFNLDGKLDIAATNWVTWNASILLGNGNGSFQTAINSAVFPANYESVAVGDFNGDGKPDLVAAQGFSAPQLTVWLGNGDGTFPIATTFGVGGKSISVATGDFNADGKTDVVSANIDTSTVSLLLGNGDGSFQAPVNFAVGTTPHSIAVADFDRNGTLDVATANYDSNDVSILLNNGNGTFRTPVNMGAGSLPYAAAVGDFNNDGKLDLAVANWGSNNVSIFLGNGNGTFQTAQNFAAGSSPSSVVVGDFNRDGKLDVAVANTNSNNVSILLGNGDGSFQAPQNFDVGRTPALIAVGDFNKDGALDLVVGYYGSYSNQVTVLLNTSH